MVVKTVQKKKKKIKVIEGRGVVNGHFSFNNTILNLSRDNGEVLAQCSAGSIGYKGSKKSTAYVAQRVAEEIIRQAVERGVYKVKLVVKKIGSGRDAVIKEFLGSNLLQVEELIDKTPLKFGGTRPRKKPRK